MTSSLAEQFGPFGVWRRGPDLDPSLAAHIESVGFGAIWIGGSPGAGLEDAESLIAATEHVVIATGIVNIWKADAATLARSYHRIEQRYPGRFVLGVGVGHPEHPGQQDATRPFEPLVRYLDVLDEGGVPRDRLVIAALGPRVLRLAAERTAGAHPYLVTPEHSRRAREILGTGLLAPEQRVALASDPADARAVGRTSVIPYLKLNNYVRNFHRLGFSEQDTAGEGSDRLIDELVVSGDDATIAARLRAHREAGADHVAVQLLTAEGEDARDGYVRLAGLLGLG